MAGCGAVGAPGHMIVGVEASEVLFAQSTGLASVQPSVSANANTLWSIGSCSKAFTAELIYKLIDAGLVTLDTKIIDLLPSFTGFNPNIAAATIYDMLNMAVGVPRNDVAWFIGVEGGAEHVLENFGSLPPIVDLRREMRYNSWNYVILAEIVETLTNKSWSQNVQDSIFSPLGMTQSTTTHAQSFASGRYAFPHVASTAGTVQNIRPGNVNAFSVDKVAPAGSIGVTAGDAAKYLQSLLSTNLGGILSENAFSTLTTAGFTSVAFHDGTSAPLIDYSDISVGAVPFQLYGYGSGWLHGFYKGRRVFAHNGGTLGHSTWIFAFPSDGLAFAMVLNVDAVSGTSQFMWDWALYARDQIVAARNLRPLQPGHLLDRLEEANTVDTDAICDRFNLLAFGTTAPNAQYLDDSFLTDFSCDPNYPLAELTPKVGVYRNAFYGDAVVSLDSLNHLHVQLGQLNGTLMNSAIGEFFWTRPDYYCVNILAPGFGNIDPSTQQPQTLQLGLEIIDPIFIRV